MRSLQVLVAIMGLILASCASEPKHEGPDWIRQTTRTVDNGYIVYIGTGESQDTEKAQFRAEGMALEDLANECSFIPKGTRLEDRYVEKSKNQNMAYVKVAVEFQECTEAQKALEPSEIKKLANTSFTEQLRRYQDLEETGELHEKSEYAQMEMPQEIPPPPALQTSWSDPVHFSVMRQYVAYQKEVVVLSPVSAYSPNSPQSVHFVQAIQPTVNQIQQTAAQNPGLVKTPQLWSKVYDRPHLERPAKFTLQNPQHKSAYKNALPYIKESDAMKRSAQRPNSAKRSKGHSGSFKKRKNK
ncbi:MAG: hypothetical protein ACXVCP_17555 [Bdellovibrio sp.]